MTEMRLDAVAPFDRERLRAIIRARSFREGGAFTLASGRVSTIYFNLKPTMLDPEGAYLLGRAVAAELARLEADYVGGLELGAVPIVAAVAAVSHAVGRPVRAFFVRKQAKEHGTRSLVEGLGDADSLAGRHAVMVEDVTTTGGSVLKAVEAAREAGARVEHVITLVDREEGAPEALVAHGLTLHPIFTASAIRAG